MKRLITFIVLTMAMSASANDLTDAKWLSFSSPEVKLIYVEDAQSPPKMEPLDWLNSLSPEGLSLETIVNLGSKIWKVIEKNQPVVNVRTTSANALPKGANHWTGLSGWQAPRALGFQVVYKNLYGMEVVRFNYRVLYTFGGTVEGVGRYLSNVTVIPETVSVAWGYTFDSSVEIPQVINMGTSQNPLAGMQIDLAWKIHTVMKHVEQTESFFVKGDGGFERLTGTY